MMHHRSWSCRRQRTWRPVLLILVGIVLLGTTSQSFGDKKPPRRFFIHKKDHPKTSQAIQNVTPSASIAKSIQAIEKAGRAEMASAIQRIEKDVKKDTGKKLVHKLGIANALSVSGYKNESEVYKALGDELAAQYAVTEDPSAKLDTTKHPVTENTVVQSNIANRSDVPWGIKFIRADKVWEASGGTKGIGIVVAILDTGVSDKDNQFGDRLLDGKSFIGSSTKDDQGHGSHVAGTVAGRTFGVAPEASIMPVKVINSDGFGYESDAIAGLTYAIENGASVVNISLGWPVDESRLDNWTGALEAAVRAEVIVVAAAGNNRNQSVPVKSPGCLEQLITIGSIDEDGDLSSFSLFVEDTRFNDVAPNPNFCAPGENVLSIGGSMSGTSMATPHVAGTVALMMAANNETKASLSAVMDVLAKTVQAKGSSKDKFGEGVIDASKAVGIEIKKEEKEESESDAPEELHRIDHRRQMEKLNKMESDWRENLKRLRRAPRVKVGGNIESVVGRTGHGAKTEKPGQENPKPRKKDALETALIDSGATKPEAAKALAAAIRGEIDKSVAEKTKEFSTQLRENSEALKSVATKSDISDLKRDLQALSESLGKIQDGKGKKGSPGKPSAGTRPSGTTLQDIKKR